MKKITIVLIAVVIFAVAFTACAAQPAEESAQIANPWTEAADAQEVQDKTGIAMSVLPEGASDAEYSVMEEIKTAQVAFRWKGDAYLYRGMPGKADGQTLAGLYGELEHIEEITPEDIPENGVQLSYTEGEMGYAVWYDAKKDATYVLAMTEGAERDKLLDAAYQIRLQA